MVIIDEFSDLEKFNGQTIERALRSGKYKVLKGSSFYDLPIELIRARIALGLTQKQLAEKLGLKEQQIQRYEETDDASASFSRLTEIIKALDIDIEEKIFLPKEKQIQQVAIK